jgi:hypothetical protein
MAAACQNLLGLLDLGVERISGRDGMSRWRPALRSSILLATLSWSKVTPGTNL